MQAARARLAFRKEGGRFQGEWATVCCRSQWDRRSFKGRIEVVGV
jgi:hypothetical protein